MAQQHSACNAHRGMTLIELLITITLIGALISLATPSFMDIAARNRMATAVNTLLAHLQLARSEAVKRGLRVTVCPSTDGSTCAEDAAWHAGYLVTLDGTNSSAILRASDSSNPAAIEIKSNRSQVTYQPEGTAGGSNQTFTFCDRRPQAKTDDHRKVILSNVGRARVAIPKGSDPCAD